MNHAFVWRNGPKSIVLLNTATLNVFSRFDNFWAVGYVPKLICCTSKGNYAIGISVSHKNSYMSIGWKEEPSNESYVKKMELSSKEKWIGIDFNVRETVLVSTCIIDSKAARGKTVNSDIHPTALVFTMYNYTLGVMTVLESQEFFDNQFCKASIMRRHELSDIFLVGSIGIIGAFIVDEQNKVNLITTLQGFGEFGISEIFLQNNYLLIVRDDPYLTYPIVYYNLEKPGEIEDQIQIQQNSENIPDEREAQIKMFTEMYLQPDIRLHSVQKFKDEMTESTSQMHCTSVNSTDMIAIGNVKGVSYMVKREQKHLSEIAISSNGRLATYPGFEFINFRLLSTGYCILQLDVSHNLILLDKSAKFVKEIKSEEKVLNRSHLLGTSLMIRRF